MAPIKLISELQDHISASSLSNFAPFLQENLRHFLNKNNYKLQKNIAKVKHRLLNGYLVIFQHG